jgi:hypothetical protein
VSADKVRSREYSTWVASVAALVAAIAAVAAFVLGEGYFGSRRDDSGACTSLAESMILADFRTGVSGWTGWQTAGQPSADDDPASPTGRTLGAGFVRSSREASLNVRRDIDLSGYRCLTADVRAVATTGGSANATAKLYVRVGSSADQETWHDDGPLPVGSTGQLLRLNLTQIRGRAKTHEIGVVFGSVDSSTELVMIYVDQLEAYR